MNWKRILLGTVLLLVLLTAGFVIWGSTPAQPMPEALQALQSDAAVQVQRGTWLIFKPAAGSPDTGLVFYPGGRVDYRAYAPAARAMAAKGYLVVIPRMPLNLAIFGANEAEAVIRAFPDIRHWAVGGHSLGGSMAARFAYSHKGEAQGLVFWASYPADSDSLADSGLAVSSIYGSNDGLATGGKIDASRSLLPADTVWVEIIGGNHAQFGWYGPQSGDRPADIDRAAQQEQVITATLALLQRIQALP